ncbi:MAG: acetoacetate--CoA ligase, partial [Mesorhizobium sp.]|nr:acetoacetate--CoA ligase [Mesorhizobium sp.]
PDFGEQGVLDRFGQIEPVVFIVPDGYWYNGKAIEVAEKVAAVAGKLASVRKVLIVDYLGTSADVAATIDRAAALEEALSPFAVKPLSFERLPFSHPLYILFSSGTTGIPKCIVHSAGGTLLQHVKEHRLHAGLLDGDRFFYFTTCGWMMWNWLASGLASGATLLLYDGSPFYPDGNVLFDFADAEKMTYFGTSAKFIDSVRKAGLKPIETHALASVRTVSSTGSPLSPEDFRFVYEGIRKDVHLASISGGTDIVSCFVLGVPTEPVWVGEIQGAGLGMAVDVWDDQGKPIHGEKGELVCTKAFPCMPVGFWNDADGKKYRGAYFERFDNIWCHGDFAEWTQHGGIVIHGRSDDTIKIAGKRTGPSEIEAVLLGTGKVAERAEYVELSNGERRRSGNQAKDETTVSLPISRDLVRRIRMTTRRADGRSAVSHVRVVERITSDYGRFTLVEVRIETGRTHQIRVHMQSLGHPVVGDSLYGAPHRIGGAETGLSLERNFLHAAYLAFTHPQSRKAMDIQAPLPPELEEFLAAIRAGFHGVG